MKAYFPFACLVLSLFAPASSLATTTPNVADMNVRDFFDGLKKPTIVSICGSQRVGSFNKMLHDAACKKLEEQGAIVQQIDLESLNLPLYNPNEEEAHFPESAKTLKSSLVSADGIFITCPEYNGFVTPIFLNAMTWATRGEGGMYDAFKGKVVSAMATSPGPMGGLRMLRSLAGYLQDMGAVVVPGHNSIGSAFKVFDDDGNVMDDKTSAKIDAATGQLVHFARYEANRERDCTIAKKVMELNNMGEYGQVDV